jgi:hypothetical protein
MTVAKSKEVKTIYNLSESSTPIAQKGVVLPVMMMLIMMMTITVK